MASSHPLTSRTQHFLLSTATFGTAAERVRDTVTKRQRKSFRTAAKPTFQWIRGELIGKGSYGRVYLALNASTGEVMAVKQVELPHKATEATTQQKEVMDALKFEGETLYELDHPHIVRFLGYEENPDSLSIFLEYVPGGTIESCLRQHGSFSENLTKSFTTQILEGLEYLHDRGIIHRDLKSANILVEQNGVCKISDFGVSKQVDLLETRAFTGLKGTVFWMAPEVVDPQKLGYDTKVDIWSVGCLVLEMWTGVRPWFGEEVVSVMLKLYQHKSAPPLPSHLKLTADASDFRELCFIRHPSERPSAVELKRHPYLSLDQSWSFTPEEIEIKPDSRASFSRRRQSRRSFHRQSTKAAAPPVPSERPPLPRINIGRMKQALPPVPGPPIVFITPPATPAASKSPPSTNNEVFNWAATLSSPATSMPSSAQPKKNFYVVNPDSESDDEDEILLTPDPPYYGYAPAPPMYHHPADNDNGFESLDPAHAPTASWATDASDSELWQRAPDQQDVESPWHRPDLRNVYEHLEEFFPEHDIDKPVVDSASDSSFRSRKHARRSIRMLANEHMSRNLHRRGTRIWGGHIEELVIQ